MGVKEQVIYQDQIYEVVYDHKNGQIEISKESKKYKVLLVEEKDVQYIDPVKEQSA